MYACGRHESHVSAPSETHIARKSECRTRAGDINFALNEIINKNKM